QQTHSVAARRTQDALAAVHQMIGDLCERIASLESDIRDRARAQKAAPVTDLAPELAPAPKLTEPPDCKLVFDSALTPDLKSESGSVSIKTTLSVGTAVATQPDRIEATIGTLKWSCWPIGTAYLPRSSTAFTGTRWIPIEPTGKAGALDLLFSPS